MTASTFKELCTQRKGKKTAHSALWTCPFLLFSATFVSVVSPDERSSFIGWFASNRNFHLFFLLDDSIIQIYRSFLGWRWREVACLRTTQPRLLLFTTAATTWNIISRLASLDPFISRALSPKCPHHDFVSQAPCPANRTREMVSLYVAATLNLSRPNCYRVLRTVALAILSNQTLRQTLYLHFDHTSCRNLDPSRFEGNWIGMYNNNWIVFPRRIFSSMCREKE